MQQPRRLLQPIFLLALFLPFVLRAAQAIGLEPFPSALPIVVKGDIVFGTPIDVTGGSGTPWEVQMATYHSSPSAIQSGTIDNNASSTLAAKVTGSGRLSFWWSVSSEQNYDKLSVTIDDVEQESITGTIDWQKMEYTITGVGEHLITWTYAKDSSQSAGSDCGWLDDVSWEPDGGQSGGQQTLELTTGWNWVGFRVLPQSHKVGDVLGTSGFTANDLIQTNGGMSRFNGAGWLPSGFTVDYGKMYQLYTAKALTLNIQGSGSSSSDTAVASGWNWMSNPTNRSITPAELVHSGGWTAGDRIQNSNRSVTFTGNKWIPSTGFTLEPGQGSQLFTARDGRVSFGKEDDDEGALYVVVDLSGGPNVSIYPVRYSSTGPDVSDDKCRTTELWLRKIPKGTFIMGSPEDEVGRVATRETQHQVTLTEDYYIGVFECTQRQWELVMGDNPSYFINPEYYATRPVERVSYNMIRGTSAMAGAGWPTYGHAVDTTSFMGKLQAKTGLTFDLPTEAQWEYACRAGTTTALNSGKNLTHPDNGEIDDAMNEVGRYKANCDDSELSPNNTTANGTAKVGSYLPNAWGLYDMHGNLREWCLDWYQTDQGTSATMDPIGADTGTYRVSRGGYWRYGAGVCRSAQRDGIMPKASNDLYDGFRIACHPQSVPVAPDQKKYAVVDLSAGPNASSYPVRYSSIEPDLSDDTCRTTELWLRKIPAGTFIMGSSEDEMERDNGETRHQVTLTQDYYIGVFECTQRQWELVMGTKPSYFSNADYYATRPVEQVSYDMIRGTGAQAGASWPACGHTVDATSFMGKLQTKTGLVFDLPTEAQWEHACRAGTMTALNSGKDLTSAEQDDAMAEVGRYWYNGGSGSTKNCTTDKGTAKVGSYLPNAWGLYDMHGNVYEYCLDWYDRSVGTESLSDPAGPDTGTNRMGKGGNWGNDACYCRSAFRLGYLPLNATKSVGFRIVCHPNKEAYIVVDLSGGPNASSYPVRYSATGPSLSDDTCRTTELWLRRIPAGTFIMGSPEDEVGHYVGSFCSDMTPHQVTLTKDYYMGVFECTQKQWELVMGDTPASYKGDCRPVDRISYDMIRGTSPTAGAGWPTYGHTVDATSFMGKLQAKTGLAFDLPTEAQWECACRAGTTTALNSGKNLTNEDEDAAMSEVGRYAYNQNDGKGGYSQDTKVGSYLPNAWGLYDMHGNVTEWCLDWMEDNMLDSSAAVTDPVGQTSGEEHSIRSGNWYCSAKECRSGCRYWRFRSHDIIEGFGFRIAIQMDEP